MGVMRTLDPNGPPCRLAGSAPDQATNGRGHLRRSAAAASNFLQSGHRRRPMDLYNADSVSVGWPSSRKATFRIRSYSPFTSVLNCRWRTSEWSISEVKQAPCVEGDPRRLKYCEYRRWRRVTLVTDNLDGSPASAFRQPSTVARSTLRVRMGVAGLSPRGRGKCSKGVHHFEGSSPCVSSVRLPSLNAHRNPRRLTVRGRCCSARTSNEDVTPPDKAVCVLATGSTPIS